MEGFGGSTEPPASCRVAARGQAGPGCDTSPPGGHLAAQLGSSRTSRAWGVITWGLCWKDRSKPPACVKR